MSDILYLRAIIFLTLISSIIFGVNADDTTSTAPQNQFNLVNGGCYKTLGPNPKYMSLPETFSVISWPPVLYADAFLNLRDSDGKLVDSFQEKYTFVQQLREPCVKHFEISDSRIQSHTLNLIMKLRLSKTGNEFTSFDASIVKTGTLGLIEIIDKFGFTKMKVNIVLNTTQALPESYTETTDFSTYYPQNVDHVHRCILLKHTDKYYKVMLDSRTSNIPWFTSVTAIVKSNGLARHTENFSAIPTLCSDSDPVYAGNLFAYVTSPVDTTTISWKLNSVKQQQYVYNQDYLNNEHNSVLNGIDVQMQNVVIRTISKQIADSNNICTQINANSVFLFEAPLRVMTCLGKNTVVFTRYSLTDIPRVPLESYMRDKRQTLEGHTYHVWVRMPSCVICE